DARMNAGKPQSINFRRAVRQYLDSLRLAGVEWVAGACASGIDVSPQIHGEVAGPAGQELNQSVQAGLEALRAKVSACTRCAALVACRKQTVFGVGRVRPELCFV